MIDVTYGPNAAFHNVDMSFDKMYEIMTDCFVEPETFIKLTFDDGLHGAIRKKRHNCIY
jgi:hypothetical protein